MKKYAKYGYTTCRGFSPWKGGGCILVTNLPLTTLFIEYAIFELYLPLCKVFSYENRSDIHKTERACQTHFHMNSSASGLVKPRFNTEAVR